MNITETTMPHPPFLQSILSFAANSCEAVCVKNCSGLYLYANTAFCKMYHIRAEQLCNHYDYDIWEEDIVATIRRQDTAIIKEKTAFRYPYELTMNEPMEYAEMVKTPILDSNGDVQYIVCTCRLLAHHIASMQIIEQKKQEQIFFRSFLMHTSKAKESGERMYYAVECIKHILHRDDVYIYPCHYRANHFYDYKAKSSFSDQIFLTILNSQQDLKQQITTNDRMYINEKQIAAMKLPKNAQKLSIQRITVLPVMHDTMLFAVLLLPNITVSDLQFELCEMVCGHLAILLRNNYQAESLLEEYHERRLAEEDVNAIFMESVEFLCIADMQGYFTRVNPLFISTTGYTEKELLTIPFMDFVVPEDREETTREFANLLDDKSVRNFVNRYYCKDGSVISLQWRAHYVRDRNFIIASARDITMQRTMEAKNQELLRTIEIEKVKSNFLATLSHELKTPINIILSASELLNIKLQLQAHYEGEEAITRLIGYVQQNGYRLLRLVSNMLDLSKLDAGFIKPTFQKVEYVALIRSIIDSVSEYVKSRSLTISFHSSIPQQVLVCDGEKIDRILLNLISNAVKFTAIGGHIDVKMEKSDDHIITHVIDTGKGIVPDLLPYVFDRFSLGDSSFHRDVEGSGLGLSIVKSLVEIHDGQVDVRSTVKVGSDFFFSIPILESNDDECELDLYDYDYLTMRNKRLEIEFIDIK